MFCTRAGICCANTPSYLCPSFSSSALIHHFPPHYLGLLLHCLGLMVIHWLNGSCSSLIISSSYPSFFFFFLPHLLIFLSFTNVFKYSICQLLDVTKEQTVLLMSPTKIFFSSHQHIDTSPISHAQCPSPYSSSILSFLFYPVNVTQLNGKSLVFKEMNWYVWWCVEFSISLISLSLEKVLSVIGHVI